jgi:glycosyltransferase involved in cell wall biosynthesis
VVPTLGEDPRKVLRLLLSQSLRPELIIVVVGSSSLAKFLTNSLSIEEDLSEKVKVIYVKPELTEHVGVRVGKAINHALNNIDLHRYDFLLKIDADVVMPLNYLESCLKLRADLVGLGPFMLVKMEPFLKLLGGRWPEVPTDDAYVMMRFKAAGLRIAPWPEGLVLKRKAGGSWRYYYYRGIYDLKIGFDPIEEFFSVISLMMHRRTLLPIFTLTGYLIAMTKGEQVYYFGKINLVKSMARRLSKLLSIRASIR